MKPISRREFMHVTSLAVVGSVAAACAKTAEPTATLQPKVEPSATPQPKVEATFTPKPQQPAPTPKPQEPTSTPKPTEPPAPGEAPMLSEMVKSGKLPAVSERVPADPDVCPVMEMTGKYGGALRRGFTGVSDRWGPDKVTHNQLIWYNADLTLRPSLCSSWETNADASQWTFHLRKGMKWSDGAPFDSDSAKWWYENALKDEVLTPSAPAAWATGSPRVLMEMEFPDAHTIVCKFAHPNPLFVYTATGSDPYSPGHYMKQYHIALTDDKAALEKTFKDAGFETWDLYYLDRNGWYLNPELPVTHSWFAKNPISDELFLMERNPYFWQVDPDGNQLPYIDSVRHRLFSATDVFNMWLVNGEIDYQQRHVSIDSYTVLIESQSKGDYKVVLGADDATDTIALNHTTKDLRIREFFQNRDVRIALALAIDREEINELIYGGLAFPRQYSPPEQSPQYYPELSNAYIEYDPARANELLDQAGYAEKDSEGFRKWKDGSGEVIDLIVSNYSGPTLSDEGELILKYWAEVGIKAAYNNVERGLAEERGRVNEVMIEHHKCSRAVLPIVDPAFFIGSAQDKSWCKAWTLWYNNPQSENAEEPPADHFIRQIWDLWAKIKVEPDLKKQDELLYQIFDILKEEIPMPGVVGQFPALIIVKNGLRNLKPGYVMPISNPTKHGCFIPMQTYFWEDPDKHV